MELAKNMITGCDLTPQDIDAVAVAAGPGSFTGVRIGHGLRQGLRVGASASALRCFDTGGDGARRCLRRRLLLRLYGRAEGPDLQRTV